MNKFTLTNVCMTIYCLFTLQMNAQDGYTYTLIDNGNYNFSIGAVPNASSSNFATSVQSYGFTIILPDGATATVISSLGGAVSATFFDGTNVAQPTLDGYLITETLGSPASLPAPSTGTVTPIVTFQVNGAPTSGTLEILANNSALATTITSLKSFMQADMIDNGTAEFVNVVDPNASGLSGTPSFDFETLSVEETQLEKLLIFPNPATDVVTIQQSGITLQNVEIFDMNGRLVLSQKNNLENIQLSNLKSGMYMMRIATQKVSKTIKLLKQ
ncbi:T9SS type A sorting domain-containing protein [Kordia sp.]|uniref:T9SS type A sorting domain-containing protein n=1 Tax=Kordia sp. TaxID=1965332 RepID=UPI003B5B18FC